MYKPLKDVNTGVVYQWTNTETQERVNVDREHWKVESEWTEAEVAALFTITAPELEAAVAQLEDVVFEDVEEVEEPQLPLEIDFTLDSSKDD